MSELDWAPQKAFADHFLTDADEIIKRRTVFADDIIYHVDYGGRGSAKTWTWADAVVVEASLRPIRILVTREMQISIEESIKDEIESAIINRGLEHFFDAKKTWIDGLNGSKFIFKGIKNNIKNLKSISNVDVVLCEEAEDVQKDSWDKLLPSIRPKSGRDPIFIILFNPGNELDDTYQRWVVTPPEQCLSKLINWRDNKYFPKFLDRQRLHCKKTMPLREYEHIWEGKPKGPGGDVIIDLEWIKAARFASKHAEWHSIGRDQVGYDPAGQGRDSNAAVGKTGNCVNEIDEWVRSPDLKVASKRAFGMAVRRSAEDMLFDTCGGFGDGVEVFVKDAKIECIEECTKEKDYTGKANLMALNVKGFDAGAPVHNPKALVNGTTKKAGDIYSNLKAQAHGITAQKLYNTYRFIVLNERDIDFSDMLSLDIEDNAVFNKLARELSTPLWVKSLVNSKKKVEDKKAMEKRTGLPSPNIADAVHMLSDPSVDSGLGNLLKMSMGNR